MIQRILENTVRDKLSTGKAIILMGARQVGKTILVKAPFKGSDEMIWLNGDELDVQYLFESISATSKKETEKSMHLSSNGILWLSIKCPNSFRKIIQVVLF